MHKKPDKYLKLNIVLNKKKSLTIRNCQVPTVFLRAIKDIFPLQNPFVYMTSFRRNTSRIVKNCLFSAVFLLGLLVTNTVTAQDGKTLFNTNCASCHQVHKKSTGPALAGVEGRWQSKEKLYSWVKNSAAFLKTGDEYDALTKFKKYIRWRAGQRKRIKRRYNKRERRQSRCIM